jgi:hypothetical protein
MASGQNNKLRDASEEQRIGGDQECSVAHLGQRRKGRIDLANGAGIQDRDLLPDVARRCLNINHLDFCLWEITGVDENGGRRGMGPQLTQQLQPLRLHLDK